MALADTAKLLASLELKDNFTPGVKKAEASLGRLEQKFGRIGGIASKGFSTIGTNLKNLVTGPAGIIAGGAAIFALTNFISGSVAKAREFGDTIFKVQAIIGGTTQQVSQLVDVLGDYGIASEAIVTIGGMFEKNLANLTKTQKSANQFQKDYGIGLVDNTGKAKDFNTVLLDAADLFTSKTIPQSTKAAALAKLYGRNWKELIPILSLGRTELEKTLGKAITLTDAEAKSLEKARKAGIKWEDALGDLQTMIGIELLPVITKFVRRLTAFVTEHGPEIRQFFKDAATFALGMGQAIKRDVLPAISKIGEVWAGVPDDLKKILIGGFVVNKLSGGAITGIVGELAKGLIKGVLGITAGVVNINAAKVIGGGGLPGGAAPVGAAGVGATLGVTGAGAVAGLIVGPIVQQMTVEGANAELRAAGIEGELHAMSSALDFPALIHNLSLLPGAFATALTPVVRSTNKPMPAADWAPRDLVKALGVGDPAISKAIAALGKPRASDKQVLGSLERAIAAIKATGAIDDKGYNTLESSIKGRLRQAITDGDTKLAAKLNAQLGALHRVRETMAGTKTAVNAVAQAVRNKKLSVKVTMSQAQRQSINAAISGTGPIGKKGFHYTSSDAHKLDVSRVLATGAVGLANRPTPAIFGEAGPEAFAILRKPKSGFLGGGGAPHIVNVTVNIDPRRVTKKQTSSGIYKTYVAT